MYIKIDKNKILEFFVVFVFIWYGFTIGWEGKISPGVENTLNRLMYVASILALIMIGKSKFSFRSMILPIAMMLVVIFFDNADLANGYSIRVWSTCACLLFYCFGNTTNVWHSNFMKLLVVAGVFYSFTTLLAMLIPAFFYNVCVPFFRDYGYSDGMISLYQSGYITGFSPHYSTTAIYLAVTFGAYISYSFVSNFTNKRANILAIVTFACILFTGKRAHSIFLLATLMILYLSIHCDEPVKRWGKILIIIIIALVLFTIAAQLVPQLYNVVNRFIETKEAGDIELGRGKTRALALELWLEKPILGIGWNKFMFIYEEMTGIFLNVHCVYVQLLCETGIVGTIIFITFFVSSLVKAITLLRRMTLDKENDSGKHLVIIYSVFIQVFFLLYCFTGNPLYDNPTLFTYLIGCAMSEYYWINREGGIN